jgi:exosortase E/protease (VPEID-CTERM system)
MRPRVLHPSSVGADAPAKPPYPVERRTDLSLRRIWIFFAVLGSETLAIAEVHHPWLKLHQAMAAPIAFAVALVFFGRTGLQLPFAIEQVSIRTRYLVLHGVAIAVMSAADFTLLGLPPASPALNFALIACWCTAILTLPLSLSAALFSWHSLTQLARRLRHATLYATLTTFAVMMTRVTLRHAWDAPSSSLGRFFQHATFAGVKSVLGLFYATVVVFPSQAVLGTPKFAVEISGVCSGIESLALMLVLTLGWLIVFRRELVVARAVCLVPITLVAVWLLNLVRLTALISIGDAGHSDIAMSGFHSEAGWLMFNLIAIGFLFAAQNVAWLRKDGEQLRRSSTTPSTEYRVAAACLIPFLSVVAVSLLGQLVSTGVEWFYPLRFFAAAIALWHFRSEYRRMDWHFGWLGLAVGAAVFGGWLLLSHLAGVGEVPNPLGARLALLPPWERASWLAVRCLAAVVTVPVAEELAFRGYVARRIMASDVNTVGFSQLSPFSIIISSVAFGAMHGRMWIAGTITGLIFAVIAKRRGRIGEAVAAHITANALLALWVFSTDNYSLW